MTEDEKWARLSDLYVRITTMEIADYSLEMEMQVVEYFGLRKELKGF